LTAWLQCAWHPATFGFEGKANMARIAISVKGLFATPVAAVEMPGAAALNAELERVILERRSKTPFNLGVAVPEA
jgi:hypothetical protein